VGVWRDEVYVIDTTGRVQVFTRAGEFQRKWRMPSAENGTPTGVAFDNNERVLIADTHYSTIREYTSEGELVTEWGSYGSEPGKFIYPTDITRLPDGRTFISEYGMDADRVQVFDENNTFLFTFGQVGSERGQFSRAMAIEALGDRVFVCDTVNHRLQVFDLEGQFIRVIGQNGESGQSMKYPYDAALVPEGGILACEYGNNRVSRFDLEGQFLGAFGGPGRELGKFHGPRGIAVSEDGTVYVADTENHRIQAFELDQAA
jgi:DNA-binding beta-propeller fold protein YncE